MTSYLWLGVISLISWSSLFYIFNSCLVPTSFVLLARNGATADRGHDKNKRSDTKVQSLLQESDNLEISMLLMTWLMGVITSIVSVLVFLETKTDTLLARSEILIPYTHFGAWYYIIDTFAMFRAFVAKRNLSVANKRVQLQLFVRSKWPSLLHHFLLVTVGYPLVVNAGIRGYKGDFYAAALLAQDFSNPFLAKAKILKILGQTKSVLYKINGALLIMVFLVVRVLNMPLCIFVFAAQYHDWDLLAVLARMRWSCYAGIIVVIVMQSYWFLALLRLAGGVVKRDWKHNIK